MPSLSIHLKVAQAFGNARSTAFFVGTVLPDAISDWRVKDVTHLRDRPDREAALRAIAKKTDPKDDFAEGVLIHLFTDLLWDRECLQAYWDAMGGRPPDSAWVKPYRREIHLAGAWLYHRDRWLRQICRKIRRTRLSKLPTLQSITLADAKAYIKRNTNPASQPIGPPSAAFPPETVDTFIEETVKAYRHWRG
ncbi:MAG: hypothetical protein LBR73_01205 [Oscillospiraceae bacterium]|jgi:hypothetical protein|nr:hypothetical protein [Oscillospiraceae bacterium]